MQLWHGEKQPSIWLLAALTIGITFEGGDVTLIKQKGEWVA